MSAVRRIHRPKLVARRVARDDFRVRLARFCLEIELREADIHAQGRKDEAFAVAGNVQLGIVTLAGSDLPQPASVGANLPDVQRAAAARIAKRE